MVCPACQIVLPADALYCFKCGSSTRAGEKGYDPSTLTLDLNLIGFSPGTVLLDRYRIERKVGAGGMGVVYRAEDIKLRRTVALKFLPPGSAQETAARKRFLREAQAAAGLMSPNICKIHEIHEEGENPFISMEYIEGVSLRELLTHGPLEASRAVDIAAQVAKGLQDAHGKGIIHRDIKCSNIMLAADGVAKIMDFGLAKIMGTTILTKANAIVGTAAYMSPEQARGDAIDDRTDIWSLGVVLYEMLSGHLPFKGDSEASILHAVIYEEPPRLKDVNPEIPPGLDRLVQHCLRKKPDDRCSSLSELIGELKRCAMRLRPEELRTGSRERLFSSVRRPMRLAWAAPLIVLFLLSIVWLLDRKPQGQASTESHSSDMRLQDPDPQATSSPEQVKQQELDDNVSMARSALARQDPRAAAGYIEKAEKINPIHKDLLSVKNEYQAALVALERKLDDEAFGQAVRGGSIGSFKAYLERYPTGSNASKARDLLEKLEIAVQLEESRIAEEKARLKAALDDEAFQKAKQAGTEKAFEGYLHDFPEGRHASAARELASFLADQAREATSAPEESEKAGEHQAGETMLIKIGNAVLTMVWVPPGKFQMGSSSINASRNEKPVHSVKISNGFWIGKYEVTQDQWIAVMGTDPIIAPSAVLKPATSVSWEEAQLFIKELNRMTGRIFRLPTEAEWEYACRAGAADDWYGEWNAIAWTYANAKGRLQVVGQKRPNGFGLHDMIGNVWEWCQDWYAARYYRESPPADPQGPSSGEKKTVRGGSYRNYPENANSATRGSAKLNEKKDDIGVRVLLEEKGDESGPPIFPRLQT